MNLTTLSLAAAERGLVPDVLLRAGIRRLCRTRLRDECRRHAGQNGHALDAFVAAMDAGPIALVPEVANRQHYEVPAEFFTHVLGPRRKYSCCYWETGTATLAQAEDSALEQTCLRAELADGLDILELGCGWGSLSLWIAWRYPHSRITAVSNSSSQRAFIESQAMARGFGNLRVITADMNEFAADRQFDRIVSVEMFEHMRNHRRLLSRIALWLKPGGKLFIHIFSHQRLAYTFEPTSDDDWMARHFFTGGMMPSDELLPRYQDELKLRSHWRWSGTHYAHTSKAWLANLDGHRAEVLPILAATYGTYDAECWFHRWRMFFLACAELFGYGGGGEWGVSHYLFERYGERAINN